MKQRQKNEAIYLKKLGKRLKDLRKSRGYSSAEAFTNSTEVVSRAQYGRYESGRANISLVNLLLILEALKVTPEEFFKSW